ncbi:MAG: phosphatase PAP2 family protein [Prevotella sp.]
MSTKDMKPVISALLLLVLSLPCTAQGERYHGDGIDDYLRFVPLASAYVLKAAGVESASSWKRMTVNSALSVAIASGVTYGLKQTVHKMRPDRTDNKSFPSGHTTMAFAGATVLHKEFGRISPWVSVAGYGVATFTAIDRVCRNRHHWTDVATGAAIGIIGTEAGYRIGDLLTGEHSRYALGVGPDGLAVFISF